MKASLRNVLLASTIFQTAFIGAARATLFRHITAESGQATDAVINSDGSLTESGVNYAAIFKPVPQPAWVDSPWISTTTAYSGTASIGFEIDPHAPAAGSGTPTDKVQLRISHADDSSAAVFDNTRYLGFAVDIPRSNFQAPTLGGVQLVQWWQGGPYTPPLSVTITGANSVGAIYSVDVYNNATLGNPSSKPIVVSTGIIPFDSWTSFVVGAVMDYQNNGKVQLWQNDQLSVNWQGSVGYDPATIPYKNPPAGTAAPHSAFDVFFGPYRDQQNTKQQFFFDEVRWADTFTDALPLHSGFILGDINGDGVVDDFDIAAMELAVSEPSQFVATYPTLTDYRLRGDINGDGKLDDFDLVPFGNLLIGHSAAAPVPEPSGLVLMGAAAVGAAGVAAMRRTGRRASDAEHPQPPETL